MRYIQKILSINTVMLVLVLISCSSDSRNDASQESEMLTASQNEHSRDSGVKGGGDGEESGTEYGLNQTYDQVRNGARLILKFNSQSNSFNGTVENTTSKALKRVRVEVHLSNGIELGPTIPVSIDPGKRIDIKLVATNKDFDRWTAHPEVEGSESGHDEKDGEHDRDSRSEHKEEHSERNSK